MLPWYGSLEGKYVGFLFIFKMYVYILTALNMLKNKKEPQCSSMEFN